MSTFADTMRMAGSTTRTENGAVAFNSTGSGALLNLFSKIGGMRKRIPDVVSEWKSAYRTNPVLAGNLILYSRDFRNGGIGERAIGRALLKEFAYLEPEKVSRNFDTIVDAGRYDDLFALINTPVEMQMWAYIAEQLDRDIEGCKRKEPISLLAKWMPSVNTSSGATRHLARIACSNLGVTERIYRKTLSKLRAYLNVVEQLMSAGKWNEINFETVPSVAMSRYIKSYNKHCAESFNKYKASLIKGETKVNAGALFPYDICSKFFHQGLDTIDEEQWRALPNFVNGEYDVVIMADVSGSMTCDNYRPMATSVGLATYFAQHNKGAYKNMYLTFTNSPHFITIEKNQSLESIFRRVSREGMGYSTNLDRAFQAIYNIAEKTNEAPKALVVISDMEIDSWYDEDRWGRAEEVRSIANKWEQIYQSIGLKSPKLILWNVESRHDTTLAKSNDNVAYVSGYGIGPFKNLTELIELNAYDAMVKILSQKSFCWK